MSEGGYLVCRHCGTKSVPEAGDLPRKPAEVSFATAADTLLEKADAYWNAGMTQKARDLYRMACEQGCVEPRAEQRMR